LSQIEPPEINQSVITLNVSLSTVMIRRRPDVIEKYFQMTVKIDRNLDKSIEEMRANLFSPVMKELINNFRLFGLNMENLFVVQSLQLDN
jgi:hypothetical protein